VQPSVPIVDPPATAEEPGRFCPRCGAAYEPLQEYCLECGARLPVNRGLVGVLASGWQRRFAWYPGDWIWSVLGLFALAVAASVLAIVLGDRGSGGTKTIIATGASVTLGPGAATGTVSPTIATETLPTAPEPTAPETTAPGPTPRPSPRPNPSQLATWPAGKSGYTIVLESVPTSAGRAFAERRAREARGRGLAQVGVLDSSSYSSFHPGYFVVFAGIYSTASEATAGLSTAHSHGFGDAYQKQVAR
jgi:hypothetical protein